MRADGYRFVDYWRLGICMMPLFFSGRGSARTRLLVKVRRLPICQGTDTSPDGVRTPVPPLDRRQGLTVRGRGREDSAHGRSRISDMCSGVRRAVFKLVTQSPMTGVVGRSFNREAAPTN